MSFQDEIKKAIGAHGLWKGRLNQAIDTGASEFKTDVVRQDNQCEFGKWLYGPTLPPEAKKAVEYETIRKLHGDFHKIASKVLELALAGKKDDARKLIDDKSEFATLSGQLTQAMMRWSSAIK